MLHASLDTKKEMHLAYTWRNMIRREKGFLQSALWDSRATGSLLLYDFSRGIQNKSLFLQHTYSRVLFVFICDRSVLSLFLQKERHVSQVSLRQSSLYVVVYAVFEISLHSKRSLKEPFVYKKTWEYIRPESQWAEKMYFDIESHVFESLQKVM